MNLNEFSNGLMEFSITAKLLGFSGTDFRIFNENSLASYTLLFAVSRCRCSFSTCSAVRSVIFYYSICDFVSVIRLLTA